MMGNVVLRVDGISKRYRKSAGNSRSFKEGLVYWWRAKKDVTDEQDGYFWALKDVSFELEKGDVLGFMGNNGAGKSTLLKIISRIVIPTEGKIKGTGRVGSLLEVGTGFHGELTGRENIFLNGTVLGMSRREVNARFDEIVHFSGVEAFLDTPVKRYSSGMYMRLAFAVAAHLDSEILILDEVLAVGDLEFQQKCMNKIKEIALQEGRTVMFVSHNIQSIRDLCNKALFLKEGRVDHFGKTDHVINSYITKSRAYVSEQDFTSTVPFGNDCVRVRRVALRPDIQSGSGHVCKDASVFLSAEFTLSAYGGSSIRVDFRIFNFSGDYLFNMSSQDMGVCNGQYAATASIPGGFLNTGSYYISISFFNHDMPVLEFPKCLSFYIEDQCGPPRVSLAGGMITPEFQVELQPM